MAESTSASTAASSQWRRRKQVHFWGLSRSWRGGQWSGTYPRRGARQPPPLQEGLAAQARPAAAPRLAGVRSSRASRMSPVAAVVETIVIHPLRAPGRGANTPCLAFRRPTVGRGVGFGARESRDGYDFPGREYGDVRARAGCSRRARVWSPVSERRAAMMCAQAREDLEPGCGRLHCTAHGGGNRCDHSSGCGKCAAGERASPAEDLWIADGGGRRCEDRDCDDGARASTHRRKARRGL